MPVGDYHRMQIVDQLEELHRISHQNVSELTELVNEAKAQSHTLKSIERLLQRMLDRMKA